MQTGHPAREATGWVRKLSAGCLLAMLPVLILLGGCGKPDGDGPVSPSVVLASERHAARWYSHRKALRARGIALVVHGLNQRPEGMESLIHHLNGAGITVVNVSLHGHGENFVPLRGKDDKEARLDSFRTVTYGLWSRELHRSYLAARQWALGRKVPLFFVGYSLGALLGCELQTSRPDIRFDRMALFAPALKITLQPHLLKALMPFPDLVLDSLSPEAYRSNAGTPMAAYKALFETLERFEKHPKAAINVPTLVLMDREDEFIPFVEMEEMIVREGFDRWRVLPVEKEAALVGLYAHHLVIGDGVVGKAAWSRIGTAVVDHLLAVP